jgi:hypothetical protein
MELLSIKATSYIAPELVLMALVVFTDLLLK